jgi:response regulator NasT
MVTTRILIAEDNDLVSLTLEEQLKDMGYHVVAIARTGIEAVSLAERTLPDVIIMDIRMPEMDGTEATVRILAQCPTAIVMLTAYADKDTVRRVEHSGAHAYLVKPVKEQELPPAISIAKARFKDLQALRKRNASLQETLESRKMIERAKGILMQRLKLNEREAYDRLRQRARDKRLRMSEVAEAIIEAEDMLRSL